MLRAIYHIAFTAIVIMALAPLAVGNIIAARQAWDDSGLVFENKLLGIKF